MDIARRVALGAVLVFLLAACVVKTEESIDAVSTQAPTVGPGTVADAPPASDSPDPNDIIVQYDVFGGLMAPGPGTRLAGWTLYGDGLLVWIEGGPPTPGFAAQVWTGYLSEGEVEALSTCRIQDFGDTRLIE